MHSCCPSDHHISVCRDCVCAIRWYLPLLVPPPRSPGNGVYTELSALFPSHNCPSAIFSTSVEPAVRTISLFPPHHFLNVRRASSENNTVPTSQLSVRHFLNVISASSENSITVPTSQLSVHHFLNVHWASSKNNTIPTSQLSVRHSLNVRWASIAVKSISLFPPHTLSVRLFLNVSRTRNENSVNCSLPSLFQHLIYLSIVYSSFHGPHSLLLPFFLLSLPLSPPYIAAVPFQTPPLALRIKLRHDGFGPSSPNNSIT